MQFTTKLKISVISNSCLYIPISRDASNIRVDINESNVKILKTFQYGVTNNKAIQLDVKKNDEITILVDVPINPSHPNLDPEVYKSNGERYTKWKVQGAVEKFAKENRSLNISEYISKATAQLKSGLKYKGYRTNTVADKFEYTDELLMGGKEVDCIGYHSALVALLRANNIPAVLDIGFRLGRGDDPHVWAWFWDTEWKRIDILDDQNEIIGDNELFPRVSMSLGTTHEFSHVVNKESTISYMQYLLSDTLLSSGKRSAYAVFDSFEKKEISFPFLKKILSGIFPYNDFLYLLQLEDYLNNRYFRTLKRFWFRRRIEKRDTLKKTGRAQLIILISIQLQLFFLLIMFSLIYGISIDLIFSLWITSFMIPLTLFFTPFFIATANTITMPLYRYFRNLSIKKATKKISDMKNLKIIMISGSYGKTTIKNFVFQLLSTMYKTQMTAGNINTHAGIAGWINNSLNNSTQVLVCEVDGFHEGEIKDISKMIPADIAVITYLGDQHLERLNSKKILAKTLLETITNSKPNSIVITSKQTESELKENGVQISNNLAGRTLKSFEFSKRVSKINSLLSESNLKNIQYAIETVNQFEIPNDILEDTIKNIQLPDRRQKVLILNGFTVIDDSYNISFNTAQEGLNRGIKVAKDENKDLLVIFAGIPELGRENADSNEKYAKLLSKKAKFVILLNSIYRKEIEEVFKNEKFTSYKYVSTMGDAISLYQRIYKTSDYIILMHPELTDLSY
jgi:UDP-N-acetylmuramoyl-tripeptide--D-alanyl-D-alanine ligase